MKIQQGQTIWMAASLAGGFVLAVVALFAILGGYILGSLLVAIMVLASPFMLTLALGQGLRALAGARARAPSPQIPVKAPVGPVVARLVQMDGSCARRIKYVVGDEFTFQNGAKVTPPMCGPALHGIRPYVEKFRTGEDGHVARVQCPISGSILVFELRPKEPAKLG